MPAIRSLLCLMPLALAGCGGDGSSSDGKAEAAGNIQAASFSPAERELLDGGAAEEDVLAARAIVAPFTRTDQTPCFAAADLNGARMAAPGGDAAGPRLTRVAIAVDGSGSMAGRVGSRTKLELARAATLSFIDSLPDGVPASLAVFGQQGSNSEAGKARSCTGIDLLAPMSADRARLRAAVGGVRAVGWTPLAAGLKNAQAQLAASSVPGEQVIYVVSDGIETCGGDPVAVAREINRGGTRAVVNIIGFGLPTGEAAALQSVAAAGGGRFVNVTDDTGFDRALAEQMRLIENRVAASNARADNAIATGAAYTGLVQCTGDIIERETRGALDAYDARAKRDEKLPPRYQIVALMRERQRALEAARDAHEKSQDGARDAAGRQIDQREKAAR